MFKYKAAKSFLLIIVINMVLNFHGNTQRTFAINSRAEDAKDKYFNEYGKLDKSEWSKLKTGIWRHKTTGESIIFTQPYSQNITGYRDIIPLLIFLDNEDHILEIQVLPNHETKRYMARIAKRKMLSFYIGVPVKNIVNFEVDVVSGATMSSNAMNDSIKAGIAAYLAIK